MELEDHVNAMPGFRFHPTEQELVGFYLRRMVEGKRSSYSFIPKVELYRFDPWELPDMTQTCGKEWFFFVPRDSKFPNGGRPNRRTKSGYWKATGTDRAIHAGVQDCFGLKKTLVYYKGRAPNGVKTEWIMNEYRLSYRSDSDRTPQATKEYLQSSITLCRIYRKSVPLRIISTQFSEVSRQKFAPAGIDKVAVTSQRYKFDDDTSPTALSSDSQRCKVEDYTLNEADSLKGIQELCGNKTRVKSSWGTSPESHIHSTIMQQQQQQRPHELPRLSSVQSCHTTYSQPTYVQANGDPSSDENIVSCLDQNWRYVIDQSAPAAACEATPASSCTTSNCNAEQQQLLLQHLLHQVVESKGSFVAESDSAVLVSLDDDPDDLWSYCTDFYP